MKHFFKIAKKIVSHKELWLWMLMFSVVALAFGFYGHIQCYRLLLFILAQIFGVLMPGLCALKLTGVTFKDKLSLFFTSYATGYCISLIIYAILLVFNILSLYNILFILIGLASLLHLILEVDFENISDRLELKNYIPILSILFVVLCIGFIFGPFFNRSAEIVGVQSLYMDSMYWFKQCVSCTMGYPIADLSYAGASTYWHMFMCFEVASMHIVTGVEIFDLCFVLSHVWQIFLIFGATYVVLNELISNKYLVYIGCVLALLCTGYESNTFVCYLGHLFSARIGCAEGYALTIYAILFLIRQNDWKTYWLSLLFFVCALGTKAPYGAIIIVFLCVILLMNLLQKRIQFWHAFGEALPFLCLFVLIMKLFVIGDTIGAAQSNQHMYLSLETITRTPLGNKVLMYLTPYMGHVFSYICAVFIYLICANFVVVPLFIISILLIGNVREHWNVVVGLLVTSVVSVLIFLFLNHKGFSQVYFMFIAIPLMILFSFMVIDQIQERVKNRILICLCAATCVSAAFSFIHLPVFLNSRGKHSVRNEIYQSVDGQSVTKSELLAMRWVRDHTDKQDLIATNKIIGDLGKRSFVSSSFTERQIFVEGTDYTAVEEMSDLQTRENMNLQYYQGNDSAYEYLKQYGVKYAILFKGISNPNIALGHIVFENESTIIYKL